MEKVPVPIPVIVVMERVRGKNLFTASTPTFDIASQGKSVEEATDNLREAVELWLEKPGVPVRINVRQEVFTATANVNVPAVRRNGHLVVA